VGYTVYRHINASGNSAAVISISREQISAPEGLLPTLHLCCYGTEAHVPARLSNYTVWAAWLACRSPFDVETKADASPVTIADKEAERAMRMILAQVSQCLF
jgi:hypothetical protein